MKENLKKKENGAIVIGITEPILSIKSELKSYFEGKLTEFKTPLYLSGSFFQTSVWEELIKTPYGVTRSYLEQAKCMGKPTACRAVANANAANRMAIVIPCHRIISTNGTLGGYAGGIDRKKWLLDHEKSRA